MRRNLCSCFQFTVAQPLRLPGPEGTPDSSGRLVRGTPKESPQECGDGRLRAQCRILFPIAVFCICCGAGNLAQCHIVFGITGANWVTLSEPDQRRRTGDRFLGEAFAVASACLAAFARAERDSFSSRLSSSFNLWYCCEAAL